MIPVPVVRGKNTRNVVAKKKTPGLGVFFKAMNAIMNIKQGNH